MWRNLLRRSPIYGKAAGARRDEPNVVPDPRRAESWFEPSGLPSRSLQQLWFATLRWEWRTLALIPAHAGVSAFGIARGLAAVGEAHAGSPIGLLEAGAIGLAEANAVVAEMQAKVAGGGRVLVALDPLVSSLAGLPVALAADAVVVCVWLGVADLGSARRTLALLPPGRVIGAVAINGEARR